MLDYAVQYSGQNVVDLTRLRVSRTATSYRNRVLHGDLKTNVQLNDSYQQEIYLFRDGGGGFYQTPFQIPKKDFCKFYAEDIYFVPELIESSNLPPQGTCPLPQVNYFFFLWHFINLNCSQGKYSIKNYAGKMENYPKSVFSPGRYAQEFRLYKTDEMVLRWRLYFLIV